jgi:ferric-dicitrate binding protein FerR (iron transport regulator)
MEQEDKKTVDFTDEPISALPAGNRPDSPSGETYRKLHELLRQTGVSPGVSAMGREMQERIWQDLNRRITGAIRRRIWLRAASVAAAVAVLLGMTNYLSFRHGYRQTNSRTVEMISPPGMQSSVILSDGTKVRLNAGTTLSCPVTFTSKNREVTLSGEAFFDVAQDKNHPFIVHAETVDVRVSGTKFNVKAYREEPFITVTLEEGQVEAGLGSHQKFYRMEAGEQLIFDKTAPAFRKRNVTASHHSSWKDGKFYFDSMTFEHIARQLERRFNVHIHIESDRLKQTSFTGDFVRQESLEQILNVITTDRRVHYKIEGDQVYIR